MVPTHTLLIYTLFFFFLLSITRADVPTTDFSLHLATAANLDWPTMYYGSADEVDMEESDGNDATSVRRSLFWKRMRYYISYGALSANRVPCPPRSGRSYYTHDCWKARGPAHPYTRGCSAITRCRR